MRYKRVLAVGSHPDDMEFTCGATLRMMQKEGAEIYYIVFSTCEEFPGNQGIRQEWEKVVELFGLEKDRAVLVDFPCSFLYTKESEIRYILEDIRDSYKPDLVLTHALSDIHQDHATVREQVRKTFKACTIWGSEAWRSSAFVPNLYYAITEDAVEFKMKLVDIYQTQKCRDYMSAENVMAVLRYHGMHIDTEYAEAYEVIREVVRNGL